MKVEVKDSALALGFRAVAQKGGSVRVGKREYKINTIRWDGNTDTYIIDTSRVKKTRALVHV